MSKGSFLLAVGIALIFLWGSNGFNMPGLLESGHWPDSAAADNGVAVVGKKLAGIVREVTAYNVGVRRQTSATPCIGANGHDLCRLVEMGHRICAANFVSMGTILRIEEYGECVVLDRMHKRHAHRVDIAMRTDEVEEALEFGLQKRVVAVKD